MDEDFEERWQNIGFLLCVFDPDENDKRFTDMSKDIDNLEDFEGTEEG